MFKMLQRLYKRILNGFKSDSVHIAIVRRYLDANGHYIGEWYLKNTVTGVSTMMGASLDNLPFDQIYQSGITLDYRHDFLTTLAPNTVRVGAIDPKDAAHVFNIAVDLEGRFIEADIYNRFIEAVMEAPR